MPRTFLVERIVDLQPSSVKDNDTKFKVIGDDVTLDDVTSCELMMDRQRYGGETKEQSEMTMTSERKRGAATMATSVINCGRAYSAAAASAG